MTNLNPTTRTYPRSLEEAFPENTYDIQRYRTWETVETHDHSLADKYLMVTYAFCAGFIFAMLIFGA